MNNYLDSSNELSKSVLDSWSKWNESIEHTFELAGTPMEEFAEDTANYLDTVTQKTNEAVEATKDIATEAEAAYKTALEALETFASQYSSVIDPVIQANEKACVSMLALLGAYMKLNNLGALDAGQIMADAQEEFQTIFDSLMAERTEENSDTGEGMATGGYTGA
jgi:hypothetical protein